MRTAEIVLSNGLVALVDDTDLALVATHCWSPSRDYACGWVGGKTVLMHRLIMGVTRGQLVDHRNWNGLDNRRENLRICTRQQNVLHSRAHRDSSTGLKGVTPFKGKFMANAFLNGKRAYLGLHPTAQEASAAYVAWAREHHGEFFAA